jgi:glycosyltransferase involved in cell wall biosynthesis
MKVLIVNTSDINGGAARAAYRLHKSLLTQNIDTQMLVLDKSSGDFSVLGPTSKIEKVLNKLKSTLDSIPLKFYKDKTPTYFSTSWLPSISIINKINKLKPDVVHLHWINGGMIKIEDLKKIKAPIVWSLHDMWTFTGGCHYNETCDKFKRSCGNCLVLGSNKSKDLSNRIFHRKLKTFNKIKNLTIVGLSQWLADSAKNSYLLKDSKVVNLPNPIDTKIYKPIDKIHSRDIWNLPQNKKLILFGAMGATSDPRKGFRELSLALESINDPDIVFVIFGASTPENPPVLGCKTHYIGSLSDDVSLTTLYSAVDVMIVPSLQENLSNAIMESLSCGTPVVGFNIGGNSDLIDHKKNGYLAKPLDNKDLANGIQWILNNTKYDEICSEARAKVLTNFKSEIVAKKYIQLYERVLNTNND